MRKNEKHATAAEWFDYISAIPDVQYGWVEWRACEFAGRWLVPPDALREAFQAAIQSAQAAGYFRLIGFRRSRVRLHRHPNRAKVWRLGGSACGWKNFGHRHELRYNGDQLMKALILHRSCRGRRAQIEFPIHHHDHRTPT